jgi:hypothetical protein
MSPLELRDELLRQHDELRALAGIVRAAAESASTSDAAVAELRAMLINLTDELLAHNRWEEQALTELAAWGPEAAEEHAAEHALLFAALAAAGDTDDAGALAGEAFDVLTFIGAHLEREERELWGPAS